MLDMFDLFISLHPHILISLGSCALACSCVLACILASLHPYILMFVCTCLYPHILTSSYPQVHVPSLTTLHPHILRFLCACFYPRILASSYPQVDVLWVLVGIPASSQPDIFTFVCSGCLLVSSHTHILMSLGSSVRTCLGN